MRRTVTSFALVCFGALVGSALPFAQNGSAAPDTVYFEELTFVEVRDAIKAGKTTIILPTGGTEQSGPHMVVGKHNFTVDYNAREMAKRLGNALVAPTLAYVPEGNVDPPSGLMLYAGGITLPEDVFIQVILWAGRSFKVNGFTDIVLIGDKGGTQAHLKAAAALLNKEWAGTATRAHYVEKYYTAMSSNQTPLGPFDAWVREQGEKNEDVGSHAGIKDTSTLMAVEALRFARGKLVRWDKLAPKGGFENSGVTGTGNPTRATVEYGKKGLEFQIDLGVQQIKMLTARRAN